MSINIENEYKRINLKPELIFMVGISIDLLKKRTSEVLSFGVLILPSLFFIAKDTQFLRLGFYFLIVIPCVLLSLLDFNNIKKILVHPLFVFSFSYLCFVWLSFTWSEGELASKNNLRYLFRVGLTPLFFLIACGFLAFVNLKEIMLRVAFYFCLVCAIAISFKSIFSFYFISDNHLTERLIGLGIMDHQILACYPFGALGLVSVAYFRTLLKRGPMAVCLVAVAIFFCFGFVFLTRSRGPILAILITLCFILLAGESIKKKMVMVVFLVAATAMGMMILGIDQFIERSWLARWDIWLEYFKQIQENWVIGTGYSGNAMIVPVPNYGHMHSHNLFVGTLYSTGIIGLCLLLSTIIGFFRVAIKVFGKDIYCQFPVVGMIFGLICMMTDIHTVFVQPGLVWFVFWLPIGGALYCSLRESNENLSQKIWGS